MIAGNEKYVVRILWGLSRAFDVPSRPLFRDAEFKTLPLPTSVSIIYLFKELPARLTTSAATCERYSINIPTKPSVSGIYSRKKRENILSMI